MFKTKQSSFMSILLALSVVIAGACSSTPEPKPATTTEPQPTAKKRSAVIPDGNQAAGMVASLQRKLDEIYVVRFSPFKTTISSSQKSKLRRQAPVFKTVAKTIPAGFRLEVVGHANQHPKKSDSYTRKLSLNRANVVLRLLKRYGVKASGSGRLVAVGIGSEQPVNAGEPRAQGNRRVTFRIKPIR